MFLIYANSGNIVSMEENPSHYTFVVHFHFTPQPTPPQGQGMISVSARNETEARNIAKHRIHDLHRANIGSSQIKIDKVEMADELGL